MHLHIYAVDELETMKVSLTGNQNKLCPTQHKIKKMWRGGYYKSVVFFNSQHICRSTKAIAEKGKLD